MKHEKDPVAMAEDSAGTKLLKALLTEPRLQSPRFQTMDEEKQLEVIERPRFQVEDQVRDLVRSITAQSFETVSAKVVAISWKEDVKATIELQGGTDGAHALADHVGRICQVVLADTEAFTGGMESAVKPTPRQMDLEGDQQ